MPLLNTIQYSADTSLKLFGLGGPQHRSKPSSAASDSSRLSYVSRDGDIENLTAELLVQSRSTLPVKKHPDKMAGRRLSSRSDTFWQDEYYGQGRPPFVIFGKLDETRLCMP